MWRLLIAGTVVLFASVWYVLFGTRKESHAEGVSTLTVYSTILGEKRELIVHLPHPYDSLKAYPVMYVLDGSSLDFPLAETLRELSATHIVPEVIVVGIPNMSGENREKNLTPPFLRRNNDDPASQPGEADTFMEFMKTELIPYVEQSYRCSETRMIAGNSRGGLLVMYTLMNDPTLFDVRFCFSTPFWRQDNRMATLLRPVLESMDSVETFLYLSAGVEETDNIRSGLATIAEVLRQYAPRGMEYHADLTSGAGHQDNAEKSALVAFTKWGAYANAQHGLEKGSP